MSVADFRREHRRIPARLEVELGGADGIHAVGMTTNVSHGGAAVRLLEQDPVLPLNAEVEAKFRLPGQPTAVRMPARIAWVTERNIEGHPAVEVGLQFNEGISAKGLEDFLATFRFRVAVFEVRLASSFDRAVERVADVAHVPSKAALWRQLDGPEVGLVVCRASPAAQLDEILKRTEAVGMPIVVLAPSVEGSLRTLLERNNRVFCQPTSGDPLALAALVTRLLEATTQSRESNRAAVTLEAEVQSLRHAAAPLASVGASQQLLGTSAPMQRVSEAVERLAALDTTVLLVGETGTGKGVTARAIQKSSLRAQKPFIVQNCAAMPESLLDSELFGHSRGAFTGAVSDRAGLFESASGGTVFLDELTEMSAAMQAKLLHVLQDHELRRVGSTQTVRVDVRVICATNQPLEPLVEAGTFREDLYYRLAPFVIQLPALREHREDVALLAAHFLAQFQARHGGAVRTLTPDALDALTRHSWPGNVRQLQHLMERLAITAAADGLIDLKQVREALAAPTPRSKKSPAPEAGELARKPNESLDDALRRIEKRLVLDALEASAFVITEAAKKLGVNRSTLSRRIDRLGIEGPLA